MAIVRPSTVEDTNIIRDIAEKTWWPTYEPIVGVAQVRYMLDAFYNAGTLQQQIANGEQVYIILEEDNEPVGFAAYAPRAEDPSVYKLHKLYCMPGIHGKGYGKTLVQAVEQAVRDAGSAMLELNVNRYNPSIKFYEKMGYSIAYEEDVPIGPYWMNDYVMRKLL